MCDHKLDTYLTWYNLTTIWTIKLEFMLTWRHSWTHIWSTKTTQTAPRQNVSTHTSGSFSRSPRNHQRFADCQPAQNNFKWTLWRHYCNIACNALIVYIYISFARDGQFSTMTRLYWSVIWAIFKHTHTHVHLHNGFEAGGKTSRHFVWIYKSY